MYKFIKFFLIKLNIVLAWLLSWIINRSVITYVKMLNNNIQSFGIKRKFKHIGSNCYIESPFVINGERNIFIGNNFYSAARIRMETYSTFAGYNYSPKLTIGDNVNFNFDCHISCINKITIGDNVLIASKVYITDNIHGTTNKEDINLQPKQRRLYSKGPVIIGDGVLIGEGVAILPGVTIGNNAVIGANAVITKNVPDNCVVAGNPAKILKYI